MQQRPNANHRANLTSQRWVHAAICHFLQWLYEWHGREEVVEDLAPK
jgi:hypothetical protein